MQSKIEYNDIIVEWIPYYQFNIIKEISKNRAYVAIWEDGPLKYNCKEKKYERDPNKKVILKCLNDSQNVINDFLNEV
jgi:hypothetical protein